ncbi:hypothetical protein AURDEDRAFT_124109 [Auricularia subglabra TFB-10046 SS5]|nr:hypothetical protein AURDEDRAFT_124109 [Auricularia subglabra TFB-10046 SS5]
MDLFALFPALKHLHIGWLDEFADRKQFYAQFQHARPLLSLSLQAVESDFHALVLEHSHLLDIPTIDFHCTFAAMNLVAARLPGTLGIELEYDGTDFVRYTILSHSHGWRRIFAVDKRRNSRRRQAEAKEDSDWPPAEFYDTESVGKRVTTLSIDASIAHVSSYMGELSACETLHLTLDDTIELLPSIDRPLTLPNSKRITLRAASPVYATVRDAELGHFLEGLVGQPTSPVTVVLEGVYLSGDAVTLSQNGLIVK